MNYGNVLSQGSQIERTPVEATYERLIPTIAELHDALDAARVALDELETEMTPVLRERPPEAICASAAPGDEPLAISELRKAIQKARSLSFQVGSLRLRSIV